MTYKPNTRREYKSHPVVSQWNDACNTIHRRQKAMYRAAGVYKPGSEHYPYPEPNTEEIGRKINQYFQRISKQEHERLIEQLGQAEYHRIYGM